MRLLAVVATVLTVAGGWTGAASGAGGQSQLKIDVPVNLVFVGFRRAIDRAAMMAELPAAYEPVIRTPNLYGVGRDLRLKYRLQYRTIVANTKFQDDFFQFLASTGQHRDLTEYQRAYNEQQGNVLDVTGPVLYADAPSVEKWLATHAASLGVDVKRSYTVFFINWFDRPDFQFHLYEKVDEPSTDLGINIGEMDWAKVIAWGGTSSRTWFFDASAGPDFYSGSYDVDNADLDGDGVADYRLPPIWEYRQDGYRKPRLLGSDLGKIVRYVAINQLFTTSPDFDPLVTTPKIGGDKVVHIEMLEDDPATRGTGWIDPALVEERMKGLQPYYAWQVHLRDRNPIDEGAERAFRIAAGLLQEDDCWTSHGYQIFQLLCYFSAYRSEYVPGYGARDYVAPMYAINTTDANMGDLANYLGLAMDNGIDGTQTICFAWSTPTFREYGGFTGTVLHELGHHFGIAHPYDGFDSELQLDYSPTGDLSFAVLGIESQSAMGFGLTTRFGQFEMDNMFRWELASYLSRGAELRDQIRGQFAQNEANGALRQSELDELDALGQLRSWNLLEAVTSAKRSYEVSVSSARQLGIVEPELVHMVGAPRELPRLERLGCERGLPRTIRQ